jgi:hypothetical protein
MAWETAQSPVPPEKIKGTGHNKCWKDGELSMR